MRSILATVIAVGVLSGTPVLAAAPVGTGKVYSGSEGEVVAVIPLTTAGPKGEKQVLLSVQGTDSEFDGKSMLHVVHEQNRGVDYITQYKGEDFYTLIMREAYGSKKYEVWVPGRRKAIIVSFDEKRTQALKGEDAYGQYEKLKKDGTLAKLAAFNRPEREAGQQEGFTKALKEMNEACGTQVTATIDWKSVTDDIIKRYSIASYCGNPLESLGKLCGTPVGKRVISAKVKQYRCQFGPEMKLELNGSAVSFTTQQDASNQEEYATKFFKENL
ncbi:hypothetical protein [Hyalangium minutum]|uniref:Lipoprotein n=1 Tax=Hyalangium minutum TaxID=394096 RepID=A0A085WLY8_9BACT|nr:hypothetical protein [Hyalangium minutum]KFE68701.1 hypothetical protein DB31_7938 [Hyalangium minutum]